MKVTVTFECDVGESAVKLSKRTRDEWMGYVALADALQDLAAELPAIYAESVEKMGRGKTAVKPNAVEPAK
jgi:hypothetical protein